MRAQPIELSPPVKGFIDNQPVAEPDPFGAEVLEDWLPTTRGVKPRGGITKAAQVGGPAKSLLVYNVAGSKRFFGATETDIYNITSLNSGSVPSADVSSLTNGDWSSQMMQTAAGNYLVIANGADSLHQFDGTGWNAITDSSTINITGVTTSTLSDVWSFKSRLFFVQKDTLKAWYLPTASIGGAALELNLSGVFKRGGSLLFGATWSLDSGDGMDDKCVFVTDEGEIAIYEGTDPSSAFNWEIIGRYDIGKPLGKRATMQAGGDLLIATDIGIVPLSQVINKDPAALSFSAITRNIPTTWKNEADRSGGGVELHKWSDETLGFAVLPDAQRLLTVNLETGAWASQRGWFGDCGAVFDGKAYVGRDDNFIYRLNNSGRDDGVPFAARLCMSFNDFGDPTKWKEAQMMRCAFFAPASFTYQAAAAFDYSVTFDGTPEAATFDQDGDVLVWGQGNWGEAVWAGSVEVSNNALVSDWLGLTGGGYTVAPIVQITSDSANRLDIELVRIDLLVKQGSVSV